MRDIGIIDNDREYLDQLQTVINQDDKAGFKLICFTDEEKLISYVKECGLQVILAGGAYYMRLRNTALISNSGIRLIPLTDIRETEGIFKYQRVKKLITSINQLFIDTDYAPNIYQRIAVFSPIARSGKTRLAMSLAFLDEVRGGLLLKLEDYADSEDLPSTALLYQIINKIPDIGRLVIENIKEEQDVNIVSLVRIYLDFLSVSASSIRFLMDQLFKSGRFSTLCFDFGSCTIGDFSILEEFDYVLMPTIEDEISKRKLLFFFDYLKELGKESLIYKFRIVNVPDAEFGSERLLKFASELLEEMNGRGLPGNN